MIQDKDIKIYNRYGLNVYFKYINENLYEFIAENAYYTRIGYSDSDCTVIDFVDPEGGPFIKVGSRITQDDNVIVDRIYTEKDGETTRYYVEVKRLN